MFPRWRRLYHRVEPSDKELEGGTIYQNSGTRSGIIVFAVVTLCGIVIFMLLGLYQLYATRGLPPNYDLQYPCGNSSVEALERGCSFDQLMWAWYPKHCPHYTNDLYLNAEPERPWQFYSNPYTKRPIPPEEWSQVLDNEIMVYGERREHLTHCVYMFLGVGQILRDGGRYTPKQAAYEHLEHCSIVLLEALRNDASWYEIQTGAGPVSYDQNC